MTDIQLRNAAFKIANKFTFEYGAATYNFGVDQNPAGWTASIGPAQDRQTEAIVALIKKLGPQAVFEVLPAEKDMQRYEGIAEDGGIDVQTFDDVEDPRGEKNGGQLAHLANFASDTGYNTAIKEVKKALWALGRL